MKNIFIILWLISIVFWAFYTIRTIVGLVKDKDYYKYFVGMQICYVLTVIFYILEKLCG